MARAAPKHRMRQLAPRHEPPGREPSYGQGRGGRPWRRTRDAVLVRDGRLCQPCRRADRLTLATEVDHIVPLCEGGSDDDANLEAICRPCHGVKTQAEAARARRPRRPDLSTES